MDDEHAKILLSKNMFAIVDADNYDRVRNYQWHVVTVGSDIYARNSSGMYMHRFILYAPKDLLVDHINFNGLDNRKSNLRLCTKRQNQAHCRKRITNTSGHTGVYWDKSRGKWHSQIGVRGKVIALGRFDNLDEAVEARRIAGDIYNKDFDGVLS